MLRSRLAMNTTTRSFWNGVSAELETVWTLTKRDRVARCVLLSHSFGWELRVDGGDLLMTQVCRSDQDIEGRLGSVEGRDDRQGLAVRPQPVLSGADSRSRLAGLPPIRPHCSPR